MRLRHGIARDGFIDLPTWSSGWRSSEEEYYASVAEAGFEAVQGGQGEPCHRNGLLLLGNGVIRKRQDALSFVQNWSEQGALLATCIAGGGFESDEEADALVDSIVEASERFALTVLLETHRASLTQDMWRTVRLLERHPTLRINADFSHWFTGLEMPALDWTTQMKRLRPVMDRVSLLHGRVGDRCCMQVALHGDAESPLLQPFRDLWSQSFTQLIVQKQEEVWFVPELLGTTYEYARTFEGKEEGDRWKDALLLREVATACLDSATS
jgi:hypothetical protein